jgi:hypothetical protein
MGLLIAELRPTQITVGMREVRDRQKRWRAQDGERQAKFLRSNIIPVIRGPKGRFFVVDHHHLSLALHNEGVKSMLGTVFADLSALGEDEFWVFLDIRGWVHPYDTAGRRCAYNAIPSRITGLKDDPYRSLAGELRRACFGKATAPPFSEFLWADFLRRRIDRETVKDKFVKALKQALKLAKSHQAHHLPGSRAAQEPD